MANQEKIPQNEQHQTIIKRKVVVVTGFGGEEPESQRRSILDVMRVKYLIEHKCHVKPLGGTRDYRLTYNVDVFRAPTGAINEDALTAIDSADLLIALITEQNVNVIYEIAVRNLLHDEFLILLNSDHKSSLPIYLKNMAHIEYTQSKTSDQEEVIHQHIKFIANSSDPVLSWTNIEEIPQQLADAITANDKRLKSDLQQGLQRIEDGPPARPLFLRNLVKDLDPGRLLHFWTAFAPYSVLRIRWKRRSESLQYAKEDMDGEPVVYSASDNYLTLFGMPGKLPDPDGPEPLTFERLMKHVKPYMDDKHMEEFLADQAQATERIVFQNRFARTKVPLRFNEGHPAYKMTAFLPHLIATRVVGDTVSPHSMFILIVFLEHNSFIGEDPKNVQQAN